MPRKSLSELDNLVSWIDIFFFLMFKESGTVGLNRKITTEQLWKQQLHISLDYNNSLLGQIAHRLVSNTIGSTNLSFNTS